MLGRFGVPAAMAASCTSHERSIVMNHHTAASTDVPTGGAEDIAAAERDIAAACREHAIAAVIGIPDGTLLSQLTLNERNDEHLKFFWMP